MITFDIAEEIRDAIKAIMLRHDINGQLVVQYNTGSSVCEWVGKPSTSDMILSFASISPSMEKTIFRLPTDNNDKITSESPMPAATVPHAIGFANVDWFKRALADKKRLDEYYGKCEMWGVPRDRSDAILENVRRTSAESLYMLDVVKEATTLALKWAEDNPGKRL